ncbi:uncharacterized protein BT62DRAFT_43134 [Guyanagaster necrorhizus]|uniref:Uncharacterized protein n=1 Tax=Guyanagaster necrorhizus TaxID=856835 RepID=A0A9P8AYM0_9AGAR|nr:uncharacterized protein BT62DRAFT_43134 [Guyanagaster necrorhizus MCA 3950]KAG7453034.1 hypothetical protein BT62DRAFT_43134 [Guyanagaster necrorhizus MCA 3950]
MTGNSAYILPQYLYCILRIISFQTSPSPGAQNLTRRSTLSSPSQETLRHGSFELPSEISIFHCPNWWPCRPLVSPILTTAELFVGKKETSLLLVELETGRIKATLNSKIFVSLGSIRGLSG